MKYFIVAAEASGDLHASNLVKGLKTYDPDAEIVGWGGDLMEQQGVKILKHISELSFMGFAEVLKNIRTIFKNFEICYKQIEELKPDAVILVDSPGFNLRVAKHIFGKVPRVYYYISPTVWAWHRSRMYTIRDYTNKMFVILPFEKDFYARYGIDVYYEGHPLLDVISPFPDITLRSHSHSHSHSHSDIVSLLPGSRPQEVSAILPVMLGAAKKLGDKYTYVLAAAPNIDDSFYRTIILDFPIKLSRDGTRAVLDKSIAAMVTSGTATLETGLYSIPQVVCYVTSSVSFSIAKMLVNIKYISLVNIILNEPLLKELIQKELNIDSLHNEMLKILPGGERRNEILNGYKRLRGLIGEPGASSRIAKIMHEDLCAIS